MSIFENSFFSLAGQKERITNVVSTIGSALTGKGVQANTKNEKLNTILEAGASNPYTTALIGASLANPSALGGAIKSGVSSLSGTGKAVLVGGTIAGASVIASNPKVISKVATAPKNLSSFSSNVSNLISNPSLESAKNTFKENPLISSAVIGGGAYVAGKGVSSLVSNALNTSAVRANTEATQKAINTVNSGGLGSNLGNTIAETNKYDLKTSKEEASSAIEIAKIQAKSLQEQNKTALEIAKLQATSITTSPQTVATPSVAVTKSKKKTTKKKTTKKKASTKHKYKSRKKVNGKWVYKY